MSDVRVERVAAALAAVNGGDLEQAPPELADYFRSLAHAACDTLDAEDPPPAPEKWEPDQHMVDAVLSTPKASRGMTELPLADRAWLVAGLGKAGLGDQAALTAKDIAERTACSLRLVRAVRAEPATQICEWWLRRSRAQDDELRLEQCAHAMTRQELGVARAAVNRLRSQLEQVLEHRQKILDKLAIGEPIRTCYRNHPLLDDEDVYRSRNRKFCRECNRENTIAYRKRKAAEQRRHSGVCRQSVHRDSVASG